MTKSIVKEMIMEKIVDRLVSIFLQLLLIAAIGFYAIYQINQTKQEMTQKVEKVQAFSLEFAKDQGQKMAALKLELTSLTAKLSKATLTKTKALIDENKDAVMDSIEEKAGTTLDATKEKGKQYLRGWLGDDKVLGSDK